MELQVDETIYSLVGIHDQMGDIMEQVVEPYRHHKYGSECHCPLLLKEGDKAPKVPKLILLSGKPGCGKRAVSSALVNELRRGPRQKSADIHYANQKVKYIGWNINPWEPDPVGQFLGMMTDARLPSNPNETDLTVIYVERLHHVCPTRVSRRIPRNFFETFINEVNACVAGKILIVASSSMPTEINPRVLEIVEFRYDLPLAADLMKRKIVKRFLQDLNAEMSEDDINYFLSLREVYSLRELNEVIKEGVIVAKSRMGSTLGLNPVILLRQDFERNMDDGEDDDVILVQQVGPLGPPPPPVVRRHYPRVHVQRLVPPQAVAVGQVVGFGIENPHNPNPPAIFGEVRFLPPGQNRLFELQPQAGEANGPQGQNMAQDEEDELEEDEDGDMEDEEDEEDIDVDVEPEPENGNEEEEDMNGEDEQGDWAEQEDDEGIDEDW